MRVTLVVALLVALLFPDAAGQDPQVGGLPPSGRVTDPARPDFGFSPWAGTDLTVIVAFGLDCKPCEDSVPFYKRLSTESGIDRKARRIVFLSQGGIFPVMNAIQKHPNGFKPDRVVAYPEDDRFELKKLPTVLVLDGKWQRRGRWDGPLSATQEHGVLAVIDQVVREAKGKEGQR